MTAPPIHASWEHWHGFDVLRWPWLEQYCRPVFDFSPPLVAVDPRAVCVSMVVGVVGSRAG